MEVRMKLALMALGVAVAMIGCATGPQPGEHAAHHPPAAAEASPASTQMDMQMSAMQDMHERMMAARTPDERAALMKEHMKVMQDGMAMMGRMKGGGMGMDGGMSASPDLMGKRMDMMEMMMQMMMDREAARPPAAR